MNIEGIGLRFVRWIHASHKLDANERTKLLLLDDKQSVAIPLQGTLPPRLHFKY